MNFCFCLKLVEPLLAKPVFFTRFECVFLIFSTRFEYVFLIFSTRFECVLLIFSTRLECRFAQSVSYVQTTGKPCSIYVDLRSKRVKGTKFYTRNGWGRLKTTLETGGEDEKLHSNRVGKMKNYTRTGWGRCKTTLETGELGHPTETPITTFEAWLCTSIII